MNVYAILTLHSYLTLISIRENIAATDNIGMKPDKDKSLYLYDLGDITYRSKTLEDLAFYYEDEKNAMIAVTESENEEDGFFDFYEEIDNNLNLENSMDTIFFGPNEYFTRIDVETLLHILQLTKKSKIPNGRTLLAWDMITDGRTAAFLQGREYLALDTLLNIIPEDDLYFVDFGNAAVMDFFCNHKLKLKQRKYGILAASFRRFYGNSWYTNGSLINELGYLVCGFPSFDLEKIDPEVFWEITTETFGKLVECSHNQTRTIYNIATDPNGFGGPYSWGSLEVEKLGALFNYIPAEEISFLHLEAITGIIPEVMKQMDKSKLEYFSKQQIYRMTRETRRIFILRMQLLSGYDIDLFQEHH